MTLRRRLTTALVTAALGTLAAIAPTAPAMADGSYWSWVNVNSGKCLGVGGGDMTNGTKIVQFDCINHPDQQWSTVPTADGNYYHFRNKANPNKCLGVPGGSQAAGVQLVIWDCLNHDDQFWSVVPTSDGNGYAILNANSGLIIGVGAGSTQNGAPVVQWSWEGHADQRWK